VALSIAQQLHVSVPMTESPEVPRWNSSLAQWSHLRNGLLAGAPRSAPPMLKEETRFMIKEIYRSGVTISDIPRKTEHSLKTVRAALKYSVNPPPKQQQQQTTPAASAIAVF
jgi:hypothetical protein